jgi:hypothetical protein
VFLHSTLKDSAEISTGDEDIQATTTSSIQEKVMYNNDIHHFINNK